MQVDDAIKRAKSYLQKVFADEGISQVRLEEVEFDEPGEAWLITLSVMRPALPQSPLAASLPIDPSLKRTFRVVRIPDRGDSIPSIKVRSFVLDEQ